MTELILVPLLAIHLLAVNVASAGPLVAIWCEWRAAAGDQLADQTGRSLAWTALVLLLLGSGLGLMLGVLLWNDPYRAVLAQFQRKIYFGVWEILFSLVLMLAAAAWWSLPIDSSKTGRLVRSLLHGLAATNLLYHFPFLLILISDVSKGQLTVEGTVDASQFRQLIANGSVLARVVHVWLASFAVTGIALLVLALRHPKDQPAEAGRLAVWGGRIALAPTILQIPVGLWVFAQLPRVAQQNLLSKDLFAGGMLALSVTASLLLLHWLAAIALGDVHRKGLRRTVGLMMLIVLMMTAVLRRV